MSPKRNDRIDPPLPPTSAWELRYASKEVVSGWRDLQNAARNALWEAYQKLSFEPTSTSNLSRQHRLKGKLGLKSVQGKDLDVWQYEVTAKSRIWYCPDPEEHVVWVVHASVQHPKQTD